MPRGDCQSRPCRCAQHGHFEPIARGLHPDSKLGVSPGPVVGSVTFSAGDGQEFYDLLEAHGLLGCVGDPRHADPGMIERVRRAVDDYVAGLPEVEDDAATVVELVRRGDSWHISIRAGKMYHETADDSLGAALAAVERVLGEPSGDCEPAFVYTCDQCNELIHRPGHRDAVSPGQLLEQKLKLAAIRCTGGTTGASACRWRSRFAGCA